jgi:hypothetical protein
MASFKPYGLIKQKSRRPKQMIRRDLFVLAPEGAVRPDFSLRCENGRDNREPKL